MNFNTILGSYLTCHFAFLLQDTTELFSNNGMISNATKLETYNLVPNILFYYDNPFHVKLFVISLLISSLFLTFNKFTTIASLWTYYGWVCLFTRNYFISNPSLPYIGWLLLSIPLTNKYTKKDLYYGAWAIMALSYSVSGLHKLGSKSWLNGSALYYILTSPLANNNYIVNTLLQYPDLLKLMTWTSLFAEISFGFLGIFYHMRKYYWTFFMMFHIGILCTINFADLTFGVLMIHIYTFNKDWFFSKKPIHKNNTNTHTSKNPKNYKIEESGYNMYLWSIQTFAIITIAFVLSIYINYTNVTVNNFIKTINRITEITVSSKNAFILITCVLFGFMLIEKIYPDKKLKRVKGWWKWAILINFVQLFVSLLGSVTWESKLQQTPYFTNTNNWHLSNYFSPPISGLIAYIGAMWIFYWWHLLRHHVHVLWLTCHQFHHSPSRIETATSFYKHPLEMILDSYILSLFSFMVLGISVESHTWLSIYCAIGEYIYHVNIKTPQWLGYIFQRPESHRLHHKLNSITSCPNYSDLPIYDILNGTFENPKTMYSDTGFDNNNELRRTEMLIFIDVLRKSKKLKLKTILTYMLILLGIANIHGYLIHTEKIKPIATLSVASPLPIVFSHYKGIETFATSIYFYKEFKHFTDGESSFEHFDNKLYSKIKGSYNRKNAYSVLLTHGVMFEGKTKELRDDILHYGLCKSNLVHELDILKKDSRIYKNICNNDMANKNDTMKYICYTNEKYLNKIIFYVHGRTVYNRSTWNIEVSC